MEIIIWYLCIYIVEALIFTVYSNNIFITKKNLRLGKFIGIFLGYGIMFFLSFFKVMPINSLSFLIINIVLIFTIFETTVFISCFHAFILTVIMAISELIVDSTITHITYNFYTESLNDIVNLSIYASLSKLLYFILALFISLIMNKNKEKNDATTIGEIFLFIIPTFSTFIIITLMGGEG